MFMIKIKNYTDLSELTKKELEQYIENEFGHIPIVKETEWATPDWAIINYIDDQIASFYFIIERDIIIDGILMKCGGINNVITLPEFRGKGLSTKTLSETEDLLFHKLNTEIGVLLCADALIPFYNRLNWYLVDCPVYFHQSAGREEWGANTMLRNGGDSLMPKEIDLNGLPW